MSLPRRMRLLILYAVFVLGCWQAGSLMAGLVRVPLFQLVLFLGTVYLILRLARAGRRNGAASH